MSEKAVALEFCKGLSDKEVAAQLTKSYWTIKTQKKAIYEKLGISKETELVIYMICERLGIDFELQKLREQGIELFTNERSNTI